MRHGALAQSTIATQADGVAIGAVLAAAMVDDVVQKLPRNPWFALAGVTSALAMFGVAQGLSYPLFTLLMQGQGMSPAAIGVSAAMMPLGLMTCSPFVPLLVRWFGARGVGIGAAALGALCFFAIGYLQNWFAWYPLRFIIGLVINPLYVLSEVWAMSLAPPGRRGRVMGIFNSLMGVGYAVGPLTLALVGTQGWPPFMVAIAGFLACSAMLAAVSRNLGGFDDESGDRPGVVVFARTAPALLVAVAIAAAVGQINYSLLPVYGKAHGMSEAVAATLLTAFSFGNIVMQIPLGLAAERFGGRTMILFCAAMTLAGTLIVPMLVGSDLLWPVLVVMGGISYGIYTMSTVELGNRFRGQLLVAGNAAFALFWGIGGISGPPVAGSAIQFFGPVGFTWVISVFCVFLIGFMSFRSWQRMRAGEAGS